LPWVLIKAVIYGEYLNSRGIGMKKPRLRFSISIGVTPLPRHLQVSGQTRAEFSAAVIFAFCGNRPIRAFGLASAPEAEPANICRILAFRPALAQGLR
jgi:hypothetical protein